MKRNLLNNRTNLILTVLLAIAFVVILDVRKHQVHHESARPVGRLTAEQVLSLSAPICQAITAQTDPLTLNAESSRGRDSFWHVACTDAAGHDLLQLGWNADTGQLIAVGTCLWNYERDSRPPLNRLRAIATGDRWLRTLWVSPVPAQWQLESSPMYCSDHRWILQYDTPDRCALIEVEAHSGALVYATFLPRGSGKSTKRPVQVALKQERGQQELAHERE